MEKKKKNCCSRGRFSFFFFFCCCLSQSSLFSEEEGDEIDDGGGNDGGGAPETPNSIDPEWLRRQHFHALRASSLSDEENEYGITNARTRTVGAQDEMVLVTLSTISKTISTTRRR